MGRLRKLGRDHLHRKALLRNLARALVKHERIVTTLAKAKELKRVGDNMITLVKRGGSSNFIAANEWMKDERLVDKLYKDLLPRFQDRPGGYTRLFKIPNRKGDNAEMAIIEYVDNALPTLPHPRLLAKNQALQTQMTSHNVIHGVEQIDIPPEGTPV